jgi:hypothetical protein
MDHISVPLAENLKEIIKKNPEAKKHLEKPLKELKKKIEEDKKKGAK